LDIVVADRKSFIGQLVNKEEGTSARQESDGEDSSEEKKEDAEMVNLSMLRCLIKTLV
jgi:hypothetical protein